MTKFFLQLFPKIENLWRGYINMNTQSYCKLLLATGQCSVAWNALTSRNAWNPLTKWR